jgi:hypothetical protein
LLPLQRTIFSSIVINLLLAQVVIDLIGLVGKNEQTLQVHLIVVLILLLYLNLKLASILYLIDYIIVFMTAVSPAQTYRLDTIEAKAVVGVS